MKVTKSVIESLSDGFKDLLNKAFGDLQATDNVVEITKSVDLEQRRALFVVLSPDEVDEHGDTYDAVEVEKACNDFNTSCMKANLFHRIETKDVEIEQSFITPSSFQTDSGVEIKKGAWLQWMHFPKENPNSELLWKMVKDGDITGVSVQCKANEEILDE